MIEILDSEALQTTGHPLPAALYFNRELGRTDIPPDVASPLTSGELVAGDFHGGRFRVNPDIFDFIGMEVERRQSERRAARSMTEIRVIARRTVAGLALKSLGLSNQATADTLGVHRNVVSRDAAFLRARVGANDDSQALRHCFDTQKLRVEVPIQPDYSHLTYGQRDMLILLAARSSEHHGGRGFDRSDTLHRAHASNGWRKLGLSNHLSATLFFELAAEHPTHFD